MPHLIPILATCILRLLGDDEIFDRVTIITNVNVLRAKKVAIITTFIKKSFNFRADTTKRVLISLVILAATKPRTTKCYMGTPRGGK